ncbi:hypothetical protein L195_g051772, partial [Trifolium pratense]
SVCAYCLLVPTNISDREGSKKALEVKLILSNLQKIFKGKNDELFVEENYRVTGNFAWGEIGCTLGERTIYWMGVEKKLVVSPGVKHEAPSALVPKTS